MKYIFTFVCLLVLSLHLTGQTLVSTAVESRNVVLEEFTGIYCVNCPDGHDRANAIKVEHPDDFFIINHHTGYFATPQDDIDPNFVTIYGASLAQRSQLTGLPAGTINRHSFPGYSMNDDEPDATAQYRQTWAETTEIVLLEDSYVNVGVEANWDYETNEITVHVEAYYTGDSPLSSNFMNIALLQDSTFDYQIGGGDNYNHSNRLVDFITPWDGDVVNNTTTGSFYDKTFTYTVPADYHGIPVDIANLKIVAFMVEDFNEIESGAGCDITYSNIPGHDVSLFEIEEITPNCAGTLIPQITIRNNAGAGITSLDFEYGVEGGTTYYHQWTGSLTSYKKTGVTLPEIAFNLEDINEFEIKIVDSDDDIPNNNSAQTFTKDTPITISYEEELTVEIYAQFYGSEITWELLNSSNELIMAGGPYENFDETLHSESTTLDPGNCYNFFIYSSSGQGFLGSQSFYEILSGGDVILTGSEFDAVARVGLKTEAGPTKNTITSLDRILISPNPASSQINVQNGEGMTVEIFNLVGKKILTIDNISNQENINISNFNNGLYIVKLSNEKSSRSEKIMVLK